MEEADFIAQEIHRLVSHTGGQLDYNDFCILMRYNALSRNLEAALKTARIPVRMIGAQKFFERAEVSLLRKQASQVNPLTNQLSQIFRLETLLPTCNLLITQSSHRRLSE
jgi:superfamily I DNA/RNA helicase